MSTIQRSSNAVRPTRPSPDLAPSKAREERTTRPREAHLEALRDGLMDRRITSCFPNLPRAVDPAAARALGVAVAGAATQGAVRRGLDAALSAVAESAKDARPAITPIGEPAQEAPRTHVVVPGDTLSGIAMQHGVPLPDLIAANPHIANPDLIYPGDVVNIPSSPTAPEGDATPTTSDVRNGEAPARSSSSGLPTSAAEANGTHVTQFQDPTYNPTGPLGSANCGPASLAMTLDTLGKMPPGLSPEQRIDYARAIMNPGTTPTGYVTASDGTSVPQLDTDSAYSNVGQLETAATSVGVPTSNGSGWDALDAALESGRPVVANGNAYQGWRDQFPHTNGHRYGSGDVGHFNTILGKTPDGKYIVSDPMYTGGPVEMTREQLAAFFGPSYGGVPHFLALG